MAKKNQIQFTVEIINDGYQLYKLGDLAVAKLVKEFRNNGTQLVLQGTGFNQVVKNSKEALRKLERWANS